MDYLLNGVTGAIGLFLRRDADTLSVILVTLKVTGGSMALSLLFGLPLGFMLGHFSFKGRTKVRIAVDTLLCLPTVLIGLIVYSFISRKGPFGSYGLLFTAKGIVAGQTLLALPVVISLAASAVESVDTKLKMTLISLGADRRQFFLSMLWEVRAGILSAGLAAYGRVMTEVGISMMVGGNIKYFTRTITTAIALETNKGDFSLGIALGIVLMVIALSVNLLVSFLRRR